MANLCKGPCEVLGEALHGWGKPSIEGANPWTRTHHAATLSPRVFLANALGNKDMGKVQSEMANVCKCLCKVLGEALHGWGKPLIEGGNPQMGTHSAATIPPVVFLADAWGQ